MNGPPCATCGTPQRWILERSAWGCDRCRSVQPAYGQAPQPAPAAPPMPGYGPAQPGAFAGGNSRTPSVAPGSYVAPASQPPVPPAHGPSPGAAKTIMGAAAPVLAPPPHGDPRSRAPSQPNFAPPAMPPPAMPPPAMAPPGSNPSMPAYGMPPADPRTRSPSQPNLPAYGMPPGPPPGSNPSMPAYGAPPQPYATPQPQPPAYGAQPPQPYATPQAPPYGGAPQPPQGYGAPPPYGQPYGTAPSQPGAYAQPTPSTAPPAASRPKSKKGLVLALVGVAAVGAVIAIVVVATGGGGGGGGGAGSRDDLAKQAVAAVIGGSVDDLMSLAGPEDLQAQLSDCKPGDPDADPAKARAKQRDEFGKRVETAKGLKAEVLEVSEESTTKLEKGKEVGNCTMKTDAAVVVVNAKLKVTQGDKPGVDQPAQMMFLTANDRWYLIAAPEIRGGPDCAGAVAKHLAASKELLAKLDLSEAAVGRIEKKMVARCVDDSWPDDAITCFSTATGAENEKCTRKLSTTQREKVEADITAVLEQEQKARTVPADPTPTPTPTPQDDPPPPEPEDKPDTGSGDPLPPEEPSGATTDDADALPSVCDDWRAQLAKLKTCKAVPEQTRRSMQDSYDILESTWKRLKTRNNAMRESMARSCKAGVDSVFEVRKAFCR